MATTEEEGPIRNKVQQKMEKGKMDTIDLGDIRPDGERIVYDIKNDLWQGLALKEQEFRDKIKELDTSTYEGRFVAITCSTDAIVPTWAYMLLAATIGQEAEKVVFGDLEELESVLFREAIQAIDAAAYEGKRVIIKGCGDVYIPVSAFTDLTLHLQPYAKAISFGEACSAVKVFQKKRGQ